MGKIRENIGDIFLAAALSLGVAHFVVEKPESALTRGEVIQTINDHVENRSTLYKAFTASTALFLVGATLVAHYENDKRVEEKLIEADKLQNEMFSILAGPFGNQVVERLDLENNAKFIKFDNINFDDNVARFYDEFQQEGFEGDPSAIIIAELEQMIDELEDLVLDMATAQDDIKDELEHGEHQIS